MTAQYAYLVSKLVSDLSFGTQYLGTDAHYLNVVVYPKVAAAMWAGKTSIEVVKSRVTEDMKTKLFEQGYVLKPHKSSNLVLMLDWGPQVRVDDETGEPIEVSSTEFNLWLDAIDMNILGRHEGRGAFD